MTNDEQGAALSGVALTDLLDALRHWREAERKHGAVSLALIPGDPRDTARDVDEAVIRLRKLAHTITGI